MLSAFLAIEAANPERLQGVFSNANWTDKGQMPDATLKNLIEHFSKHDLTLAARYCTRLIMMRAGSIIADGPPRDVLTPDSLADVFRLKADVIDTPQGLVVQPWGVIA